MLKFQVGDRVQINKEIMGYPMGSVGTVAHITNHMWPYNVAMDVDGLDIAAGEDEMERSQEPDPGAMMYLTQSEIKTLRCLLDRIEYTQKNR